MSSTLQNDQYSQQITNSLLYAKFHDCQGLSRTYMCILLNVLPRGQLSGQGMILSLCSVKLYITTCYSHTEIIWHLKHRWHGYCLILSTCGVKYVNTRYTRESGRTKEGRSEPAFYDHGSGKHAWGQLKNPGQVGKGRQDPPPQT